MLKSFFTLCGRFLFAILRIAGRFAANKKLPLAIAWVCAEDEENWVWFFNHIIDFAGGMLKAKLDREETIMFSDEDKGTFNTASQMLPCGAGPPRACGSG